MISEREQRIIQVLQGDLPVVAEPFRELAAELGCSQEEVVEAIAELNQRGIMRRFGAILRHHRAGFTHNVMVLWEVPAHQVDEAGRFMASFEEISHCYLRETPPGWPYNLYSMLHAREYDRIVEIVDQIAKKIGISNYRMVKSVRELKKTSMVYF